MSGDQLEDSSKPDGIIPRGLRILDHIEKNLGFSFKEMKSFDSFVKLLHRPRDPSCLATVRILFGFLMILDALHERGLLTIDQRWGDPKECHFPLFSFVRPFPLEWMCTVYLIMLTGAVGIMLGWRFRISCICFIVPYCYIFLADKSRWNNHSYLFALLAMQLAVSGANRCWSLDGMMDRNIQNSDVPLWNYCLLRGQIFLVYFIAGLKKIDFDWLGGYSMGNLGTHWVFSGFRLFLNDHQISLFVVHLGGFLLDLTIGFFMVLDFSRAHAFVFCAAFNLMNSRMFTIGMFPYVMIAVMPIFCDADKPKRLLFRFPEVIRDAVLYQEETKRNIKCIYTDADNLEDTDKVQNKKLPSKINFVQQATAVLVCMYFFMQGFLPYSHWLTKGYNTWTSGPYGYSWDMMVHNWRYMHSSVTVVEKRTGNQFFVNPELWTSNWRWTHHADMVKQFAHCVEDRLATYHNITDIEIYIDVWLSLNRRFSQRIYDPTVNLLEAEWSPFQEVTWVLPLFTGLSGWRQKFQDLEDYLYSTSSEIDVVFITDFPGLGLFNYVDAELGNTTLEVLQGEVALEFSADDVVYLMEGQKAVIPAGNFHRISPIHHKPASYMYIYTYPVAKSGAVMKKEIDYSGGAPLLRATKQGEQKLGKEEGEEKDNKSKTLSLLEEFKIKRKIWFRSMKLIIQAIYSIITGKPMSVKRIKRAAICKSSVEF